MAYQQIDLKKVRTISIKNRKSKVKTNEFAQVFAPKQQPFDDFVQSLPHILVAEDLRKFVDDIVKSVKRNNPVVAMLG
ncbi:MAG: hypothetical protein HYZ34_09670, partial [Ignavibacteriae bacterium]|nr:hypothetical protein [Ignavibacteriota bacterium]